MTPPSHLRVFPSDLADHEGHRFLLVGRIVSRSDSLLAIADAFTTAEVQGALEVAEGDLVVLDVERGPSTLVGLGVVEVFRPTAPPQSMQTEVGRFIHAGMGVRLRDRARAF